MDNGLAGFGTLIPFAVLYFLRTPQEEKLLCDTLGEEYRDYMRDTGRVWPARKANRREPN